MKQQYPFLYYLAYLQRPIGFTMIGFGIVDFVLNLYRVIEYTIQFYGTGSLWMLSNCPEPYNLIFAAVIIVLGLFLLACRELIFIIFKVEENVNKILESTPTKAERCNG